MSKTSIKFSSTSANLLNEGKSARLLAMRRKAMNTEISEPCQRGDKTEIDNQLGKVVKTELLQARQIIDQRLLEILNHYPPHKKVRFFAIRFGMSVEQLKTLPINEIFNILEIRQNLSVNLKQVDNLDYNGQFTL